MQRRCLRIHPRDNVAVLLEDAQKGDTVSIDSQSLTLLEDIAFGHKVALGDLPEEASVYKYGEEIGYCMVSVKRGGWIHNHNMGCRRGK